MTPESGDRITAAVQAARDAATTIVKRGEDLGDLVANVTIDIEREFFEEARFSFLELATTPVVEALPSIDLQRGAALEIEDVA